MLSQDRTGTPSLDTNQAGCLVIVCPAGLLLRTHNERGVGEQPLALPHVAPERDIETYREQVGAYLGVLGGGRGGLLVV